MDNAYRNLCLCGSRNQPQEEGKEKQHSKQNVKKAIFCDEESLLGVQRSMTTNKKGIKNEDFSPQ